jgi:GR25 family glycosyltransferase involved in LPS biosynthesis
MILYIMDFYCINLDERKDRWEKICLQFKNLYGTNLIRYPAISHQIGWIGCSLSHISLFLENYHKAPILMVIEDDCYFHTDFIERWEKIYNWLSEHPDQWDIFVGNPTFVENVLQILDQKLGLVSYDRGGTTNFIAYNTKSIKVIKKMEMFYQKIHEIAKTCPIRSRWYAIDKFISNNFKCITSAPYLTEQSNSYSSIEKKWVEYHTIIDQSEKKILEILNKNLSYKEYALDI